VANTICLNMIVKDEAHVLARCLGSVRPFIHHWVIVDTGSTDATEAVIRRELEGIPGELHHRPWRDFGHNRTEAIELARGKAEYLLIMDADEVLEVPPGWQFPPLSSDQYMIMHRHRSAPDMSWGLGTLVKAALPFRYTGVLHEYITIDQPYTSVPLPGPMVWGHFDSARNRDPIAKYARDAEVLERALESEPDNTRYVFYLAQSYRDSQQYEKAAEAYERRAKLSGFPEEVYVSLLEVGALGQRLGWESSRIIDAYLRAYQARPTRAESLNAAAVYCRTTNQWALAELFAGAAAMIPRPSDCLFLDDSVYLWRAVDELAIATYYRGKYEESAALNRRLLSEGHMPEPDRERIVQNLGFAERALAPEAAAPAAQAEVASLAAKPPTAKATSKWKSKSKSKRGRR
jgi:glycosyltransferase involved in cell wall biosynthesis